MSKLSLYNNSKLRIANNAKEWVCPSASVPIGKDIIVGTNDGQVYRLRPDGSEVWSLNLTNAINAIIIDYNDNIILGGVSGFLYVYDSTGTFVTNYNIGVVINCIAIQSNGKILVGHSAGIVRLNTDYTFDNTFTNVRETSVSAIIANSDGTFYASRSVSDDYVTLALHNSTGGIIFEYATLTPINCIAIQSDGKILAGTATGVYRYNIDGSGDSGFFDSYSANTQNIELFNSQIWTSLGTILVMDYDGNFITGIGIGTGYDLKKYTETTILSGENNGIHRYNADLTDDTSFISTITAQVNAIALINN